MSTQNTIFLLVGASGTGKTTLLRNALAILAMDGHVAAEAMSTTTRAPRPGEVPGVTYEYVTRDEFETLDRSEELLERIEFTGNLYGLQRRHVEGPLAAGDVFIIVDPHGADQLRILYPDQVQVIWIDAPGENELRRRMAARGDAPEKIEARIENDRGHFALPGVLWWNHIILPTTPSEMAVQVARIVRLRAEHLKRTAA